MRTLLFILILVALNCWGQTPLLDTEKTWTTTAGNFVILNHAKTIVECGPPIEGKRLTDCHFTNGATLDDVMNAVSENAQSQSKAYMDLFDSTHAALKPHRSAKVRRDFQRLKPCPSTGKSYGACPGYVRDHIVALCKGGPDVVSNMQWQVVAEAKAKDKWECKR